MKPQFHEKNRYLLDGTAETLKYGRVVNVCFEDVLKMSDEEFVQWLRDLRKEVVYAWDELGLPPKVGPDAKAIRKGFEKIGSYPVHEFDLGDGIIRNTQTSLGTSQCNAWFPTMMKTKINYKNSTDGRSIYDHFADEELFDKVCTYGRRHFKRDSFYHYSRPIRVDEVVQIGSLAPASFKTGAEFLEWFYDNKVHTQGWDYWIESKPKGMGDYTGYNEALQDQKWLTLTTPELTRPKGVRPSSCTNLIEDAPIHQIRIYEKGQKLFPLGFKAFRISWCQYPVNFSPLTAKYLYEKYSDPNEKVVVYDPSSGWGGRILGAMASNRDLHYIGTDPNLDHSLEDGTTKYSNLADYYNECKSAGTLFGHENTYEIYQVGSENIHMLRAFQKWKGKIDIVFTSPPYFAKEAYSEDEAQSYKQFPEYDSWRDGFLKQTIETACEYLKKGGYLLWNIADAKFGNDMLPLEQDSRNFLEENNMKYVETLKMTLAQMPGANRIEDGEAKAKNVVRIKDSWIKYEPIFVYRKPL